MDMKTCSNCEKPFDFDKGGLGSSKGGYVCGTGCAKQLADKRGTVAAIHNKTGAVVDSNVPPCLDCQSKRN